MREITAAIKQPRKHLHQKGKKKVPANRQENNASVQHGCGKWPECQLFYFIMNNLPGAGGM